MSSQGYPDKTRAASKIVRKDGRLSGKQTESPKATSRPMEADDCGEVAPFAARGSGEI